MSSDAKNVVITKISRRKLVRARAGEDTLPKIVGMAFGDGGVDEHGEVISPTDNQTELNNELLRKQIEGYTFPEDTTCRYECTLGLNELAGKYISEIALYDEDGDIVGIKNFMPKGKDDDVEQTYWLDDVF